MSVYAIGTSGISGVSSSYSSNTSSIEKEISKLQKIIQEIQSDDSLDAETKAQQIALYQAQISQLQAQASKASNQSSQVAATDSGAKSDTVSISDEAKRFARMPPKIDFNNMNDDELKSWLTFMQEETGSIPGAEDVDSVDELSADQLQSLRETLSAQQEERMHGETTNKMPPMDKIISEMSDDDLSNLLKIIQEKTGAVPGTEKAVDLDNISAEELEEIRSTLISNIQNMKEQQSPQRQAAIERYTFTMNTTQNTSSL